MENKNYGYRTPDAEMSVGDHRIEFYEFSYGPQGNRRESVNFKILKQFVASDGETATTNRVSKFDLPDYVVALGLAAQGVRVHAMGGRELLQRYIRQNEQITGRGGDIDDRREIPSQRRAAVEDIEAEVGFDDDEITF